MSEETQEQKIRGLLAEQRKDEAHVLARPPGLPEPQTGEEGQQ